jgi:hypothetical protein
MLLPYWGVRRHRRAEPIGSPVCSEAHAPLTRLPVGRIDSQQARFSFSSVKCDEDRLSAR